MLIDCWSDRLLYPDLRAKLKDEFESIYGDPDEFGKGKKVDLVLIENKSFRCEGTTQAMLTRQRG